MSLSETNPQPHLNKNPSTLDPAVYDAWREGDPDAGAAIVMQYRNFANMCAANYSGLLRFSGGTIDEDDLRQVGRWSVSRQARRFEPTEGTEFLSFAYAGIRGYILKEYFVNHGAVHVPSNRMGLFLPFYRERARRQLAGEPPISSIGIASLLSLDINGPAIVEDIGEPFTVPNFRLSVALGEAMSLDTLIDDRPEFFESAVSISSDHSLIRGTEDAAMLNISRKMVVDLIKKAFTVDPADYKKPKAFQTAQKRYLREGQIIIGLFGLETGSAKTLDTVGKDFGIGIERVRQIRQKAIERLQKFADLPEFEGLRDGIY